MQINKEASLTGSNKRLTLVLFCTSWSVPCRKQFDVLDQFCDQRGSYVAINRIYIDRSPDEADKWSIQSIPTTLLMDGEKEVDRFVGLLSLDRLDSIFESSSHLSH